MNFHSFRDSLASVLYDAGNNVSVSSSPSLGNELTITTASKSSRAAQLTCDRQVSSVNEWIEPSVRRTRLFRWLQQQQQQQASRGRQVDVASRRWRQTSRWRNSPPDAARRPTLSTTAWAWPQRRTIYSTC